MSRRRIGLLAILGLVGMAAAWAALASARGGLSSAAGDVPLLTVEPEAFRRRVLAEGNLSAAKATPLTVPAEVWGSVRIAWMVPEGEPVAPGEVVARLDPTELERNYLEAREQQETADLQLLRAATLADSTARNLERDAELANLELEHVSTYQRRDELVFSRLEIVESEVDEELARRRREHAAGERGIRQDLARTERELLQVERRKADLALERAATGLRLLEVTAPHSGFMIRERDWRGNPVRVGDTVWRGQKLGELPDVRALQAEVWVLEADAGGLAPGQRARVVVESRPEEPMEGTIVRVEGIAKPRVPASPVQYFGVTLELPDVPTVEPGAAVVARVEAGDARQGSDRGWAKPGQRVRAEILLDEHEAALVVPRHAVFEVDGATVVYRRTSRGFEEVPVTLGPAAGGRVVIAAGLAPGDRIALRDPSRQPRDSEPEAAGAGPALAGAR